MTVAYRRRPNIPLAVETIARTGLDAFCQTYDIESRSDQGLVSLKYSIRSPMDAPEVQDCRGLVLYEDDPTYPVCMPFRKFFNIEEPRAARIDWSTSRLLHKMDGSLMMLYYDHRVGDWRVASSGHPTAGGSYGDADTTFAQVFWQTFFTGVADMPPAPMTEMDDIWYFFELCRPDNRIVVRYDEPQLPLIGARRRAGLQELSIEEMRKHSGRFGWSTVPSAPRSGIKSKVMRMAAETDPLQLEGFVVVDEEFNRVKIKNPRYVEIHHLRGQRSPRAVIDLWKMGEVDEVLAHFPELRPQFDEVLQKVGAGIVSVLNAWAFGKLIPSRKEFALLIKDKPFSSVLFKFYTSPPEYLGEADAAVAAVRAMATQAILRNIGMD